MRCRIRWASDAKNQVEEKYFRTEKEMLDYCFSLHDQIIMLRTDDLYDVTMYDDYVE
jgi:hypothetical protein